MCFSQNGFFFLLQTAAVVEVWDLRTCELLVSRAWDAPVLKASFTPKGASLLVLAGGRLELFAVEQTQLTPLKTVPLLALPTDLLPGEPRSIAGKIDCLLQTAAGEWLIYDYKTGDRFAAGNSIELLQHYEFQLGVYAWAIQEGMGITPAKVALVTFKPEVAITAWPVTSDAIRKVQQRTAAAVAKLING